MKNNPIPQIELEGLRGNGEEDDRRGPVLYLDHALDQDLPAIGADPFRTISEAKKIEALLEYAANMEDGWHVKPSNFGAGFRNLNKKDCLLMALEFALDSDRTLIPAISQRLITEMPADTRKFLIKGVNFDRERIKAWSMDQGLPAQRGTARQVVEVVNSMREENQQQNVHDNRVRANFMRQFQLISARVAVPISVEAAREGITNFLNSSGERSANDAQRAAIAGLKIIGGRTDVARGFIMSPAETLALVWTHIENTDDALKVSLRDALKNRLFEIGSNRICGMGLTERLIDIPTAVDWSVTNAISQEQLNIEIAQMAGDVNEEYEAMFGAEADTHRGAATAAGDAQRLGDVEMRINEIKRDMFFAKTKVELVLLRDLDEQFVRGEVGNIFPNGEDMRFQI